MKKNGERCTNSWHRDNHPNKRFCQHHRSQSRQRTGGSSLPTRTAGRPPTTRSSSRQPQSWWEAPSPPNQSSSADASSPSSPSPPPRRVAPKPTRRPELDRARYSRASDPSGADVNFFTQFFARYGFNERPVNVSLLRRRWWRGHRLATSRKTSIRRTARERAKHSLAADSLAIDTDLVAYVFDRDGFYESLADRLLDNLPWHRRWRRNHWLCTCLNNLAHGVDPDTYAELVRKPTRDGLIALGFPRFIAAVLGAGVGVGLKIALSHMPIAHLTSALRVLIALVCPNLDKCPTKRDVAKTFTAPVLAEYLKEMAGESVH
jgi:hypothetical protein